MKNYKIMEYDQEITYLFNKYYDTYDKKYLNEIIKYLEKGRLSIIDFRISDFNTLLYSDETGKTILDCLVEKYDILSYTLKRTLTRNEIYVHKCIDKGVFEIVDNIPNTILLERYNHWNTLFDYLLNEEKLTPNVIERVAISEEIIKKLREKNPKLLCYLEEDILFSQKIDNITIIEFLFKENIVEPVTITKIENNKEIYDLCLKYNREDLLKYINESCFLYKKNGRYIIEELLDKSIIPECECQDITTYELFYKKGIFSKLIEAKERTLLSVIDNNETLLEILLKKGLTPMCQFYSYLRVQDIMLKYHRFDLLAKCSLQNLSAIKENNVTYLDILLEEVKSGFDIRLDLIDTFYATLEQKAKYYVKLARYGLINRINLVTAKELLEEENGLKFIEYLLREDKDLTLKVIIPEEVKRNIDIAIFLKSKGIEQDIVNFEMVIPSVVDDYYKKNTSHLVTMKVTEEEQSLLDEFKNLMLSDNLSDKDFVEYVVNEYRYLISLKNEYGIRDLKSLIEIKKSNPTFCIRKSDKGALYQDSIKTLFLEDSCANVLNHETGHVLFQILTDQQVPKEFEVIVRRIRNNPETIEKVRTYALKFLEIQKKVKEKVHEYFKDYEITEEEKEKIIEYLENCKKEKRNEYLENNNNKEILDDDIQKILDKYLQKDNNQEKIDEILNKTYCIEEYMKSIKEQQERELIDAILKTRYGAFSVLGDILDAIYVGRYKSEELIYDGNVIPEGYGHGVAYYENGLVYIFDEIMANFSAIVKSRDANEVLSYLKDITGEEFVNLLENYYKNEMCIKRDNLSFKGKK